MSIGVWWLAAMGLGVAALPLTRRVFAWLPDGGYAFSKPAGLLLVAYGLWLGASGGLIENSLGGIALMIALVTLLSGWLVLRRPGGLRAELAFWRQRRGHILRVELLFLLALAGWAVVRAYAPSKIVFAYGEKYMEFAFLNGILRSPHFPPLDPWLSGYAISYYYFGYVMMAIMTRLTGSIPGVGFDMYDALLFALTACAAYGLAANLVLADRGKARAAAGTGLLGAIFVTGMGNLEGLLHALYSAKLLPESFLQWLAIPDLMTDPQSGSLFPGYSYYAWFWWRASRVLSDLNLAGEHGSSPITEFPFFSFLLGDNHPHKLALPFVLMAIGLAFNLLLRQTRRFNRIAVAVTSFSKPPFYRPRSPQAQATAPADNQPLASQVRALLAQAAAGLRQPGGRREAGLWLFYAIALGGLGFLNTWDFPIYLGLSVLAYAAGNYWARGRFTRADLLRALGLGVGLGAAAVLAYGLFYLGFSSQAGGILPFVAPPTRIVQLSLMFGTFFFAAAIFVGCLLAVTARGGINAGGILRQVGRIWLWVSALSVGLYLLVVGIALLVLSSGRLALDQGTLEQVNRWLGGLPAGAAFGALVGQRLANPWTYLLLSLLIAGALAAIWSGAGAPKRAVRLAPAAVFAALLMALGFALVLVVEFFYLRDTFGTRMNTVFKFYFQAWVMLALASAFGAWWAWQQAGRVLRAVLAGGLGLLTAAGLVYSGMGIAARVHNFTMPATLDATATLSGLYPDHWGQSPDDWAAINWLNANAPDTVILLEAPTGGSYNLSGRVSAFTGLPALQGWFGHEYQWRGNGRAYSARSNDVRAIFTGDNPEPALALLQAYGVRYVIIGQVERNYINEQCAGQCDVPAALAKFDKLLRPVFSQGGTTIYEVPPGQEAP